MIGILLRRRPLSSPAFYLDAPSHSQNVQEICSRFNQTRNTEGAVNEENFRFRPTLVYPQMRCVSKTKTRFGLSASALINKTVLNL